MGSHSDETFGVQYSEDSLLSICIEVAEKLQAFYMGGSTSKLPYGLSLGEFVKKVIDGDL
jgi:hypothetical protein